MPRPRLVTAKATLGVISGGVRARRLPLYSWHPPRAMFAIEPAHGYVFL
jgi:hypothetical protein